MKITGYSTVRLDCGILHGNCKSDDQDLLHTWEERDDVSKAQVSHVPVPNLEVQVLIFIYLQHIRATRRSSYTTPSFLLLSVPLVPP
jgi:hypothetical protein